MFYFYYIMRHTRLSLKEKAFSHHAHYPALFSSVLIVFFFITLLRTPHRLLDDICGKVNYQIKYFRTLKIRGSSIVKPSRIRFYTTLTSWTLVTRTVMVGKKVSVLLATMVDRADIIAP